MAGLKGTGAVYATKYFGYVPESVIDPIGEIMLGEVFQPRLQNRSTEFEKLGRNGKRKKRALMVFHHQPNMRVMACLRAVQLLLKEQYDLDFADSFRFAWKQQPAPKICQIFGILEFCARLGVHHWFEMDFTLAGHLTKLRKCRTSIYDFQPEEYERGRRMALDAMLGAMPRDRVFRLLDESSDAAAVAEVAAAG